MPRGYKKRYKKKHERRALVVQKCLYELIIIDVGVFYGTAEQLCSYNFFLIFFFNILNLVKPYENKNFIILFQIFGFLFVSKKSKKAFRLQIIFQHKK